MKHTVLFNYRERQEREREIMAVEEQNAKQKELTTNKQILNEINRRRNEQREPPITHDRSKPKAKSGPSPKAKAEPSPKQITPVQPFPDGEEKTSGSQENPESAHEPKGRRGRPSNTQPTNQGTHI